MNRDKMVIELLVAAGHVANEKVQEAYDLADTFRDVEPIEVSIITLMNGLEKQEEGNLAACWIQLRALMELQVKVNSRKASELRAIPSEKRAQASRDNGKKGGRPPKKQAE